MRILGYITRTDSGAWSGSANAATGALPVASASAMEYGRL